MKLLLCDLDDTLVKAWTAEGLPGVRHRLFSLQAQGIPVVVVTNQGGVGYRYAYPQMAQYEAMLHDPTQEQVIDRPARIADTLQLPAVYVCWHHGVDHWPSPPLLGHAPMAGSDPWGSAFFRPPSTLAWNWSPTWRKPAPGMLLQALKDFGVAATDALMIGDLNADRDAAKAAGMPFQWAKDFFQPEVPA